MTVETVARLRGEAAYKATNITSRFCFLFEQPTFWIIFSLGWVLEVTAASPSKEYVIILVVMMVVIVVAVAIL